MKKKTVFLGKSTRIPGRALGAAVLFALATAACTNPVNNNPAGGGTTYKVSFESYDGTQVQAQTVKEGEKARKPAEPTMDGHNFGGWHEDEAFAKLYDFATPVTKNITLYARWISKTADTYTVSFESNGGSAVESQTVEKGKTAAVPAQPAKDGHNFGGWHEDKAFTKLYDFATPVTKNITLYARWISKTAVTYTVSFESNGGTEVAPQAVEEGQKAAEPPAPAKASHNFGGWYENEAFARPYNFETPVTENITLYAKWILGTAVTHTVNFESNGGTPVNSQTVEEGQKAAEPPAPAKNGYDFYGWHEDKAFAKPYDFDTPVTGDITLYAKWLSVTAARHTVSFESNGGTEVAPQTVEEGQKATEPPVPEKDGHSFKGWYTDNGDFKDRYDFSAPVTGNITLYAAWEFVIGHTVAFNSNGGTTVPVQLVTDGGKAAEPPAPEKADYNFSGWYADSAFALPYDFGRPVTGNITLYAKWAEALSYQWDDALAGWVVTGMGNVSDTDVVIPGEYRGKPVKGIGDWAFAYATDDTPGGEIALTSVIIPGSITTIGDFAFVFSRLTEVIIPDSVTVIGDAAFAMNQLASVSIGKGVKTIGDYAFGGNQLTRVIIPDSVTALSGFSDNMLTNITIPGSVTTLGGFSGNQLTSVTIPDSVTAIGDYAFSYNQLTSVSIGKGVTAIGEWAFHGNQLAGVIIPDSVTTIGDGAFYTNQLTSVSIGKGVTAIGEGAFNGNQLTGVTIPDSVTAIGDYAFSYNQLTSVSIGKGVKTIGDYVFSGNQLTGVTIPDSVMSIGDYAFGMNGLTDITIGGGVDIRNDMSMGWYGQEFKAYYDGNTGKAAGRYTYESTGGGWTHIPK